MRAQRENGQLTAMSSDSPSKPFSPGFRRFFAPANGLHSLLRLCLDTGRIVALLAVRDMLAASTGLLQGTQALSLGTEGGERCAVTLERIVFEFQSVLSSVTDNGGKRASHARMLYRDLQANSFTHELSSSYLPRVQRLWKAAEDHDRKNCSRGRAPSRTQQRLKPRRETKIPFFVCSGRQANNALRTWLSQNLLLWSCRWIP